MLEYRNFLDLTDEEIEFILKDIFEATKVENIIRNKEYNEIEVDITTQWEDPDEENGYINITDNITLYEDNISVPFSLDTKDKLRWKQFLLSKGCNYLLKNNPYLK